MTRQQPQPVRLTHTISASQEPDLWLHLRERRPPSEVPVRATPLLLVHGATIASALWDTALPGWSWMDRLARDGFQVFALDLRGYGGSTRPTCFSARPDGIPAYARAADVVMDVSDAVDFVRSQTDADRIDLLGGSWGSVVCGKFVAELAQNQVRNLILYAPLYAETDTRPDWLAPVRPPIDVGRLERQIGAYRWVTRQDLERRWDAEFPDGVNWRPTGMLEALVEEARFRVPNGTLVDLSLVFDGQPLYYPAAISVPTLLVRGDADPISTNGDASHLFALLGTSNKRYEIISNGAHFMVAEIALPQVHTAITSFLNAQGAS